MPAPDARTCPRCGETKPLTRRHWHRTAYGFHVRGYWRSGFRWQSPCAECRRELGRERYRERRDGAQSPAQ